MFDSRSQVANQTQLRLAMLVLLLLPFTALTLGASTEDTGSITAMEVMTPHVFSGDLRELPRAAEWRPGDPIKEIPKRNNRPGAKGENLLDFRPPQGKRDPLLGRQEKVGASQSRVFTSPTLNFAGQGFSGVNPPDTVGDVGPDYYIQAINHSAGAQITIYDKTTGVAAAPAFFLDSLGGGLCASGLGDPIVLYDRLADRWLLSEFSVSGNNLCIYISATSDPVAGGWFNYQIGTGTFPDYPKYAIWPDAYYISANQGSPTAYALDRSQMLLGLATTGVAFSAPPLAGFGFQALIPSDLDGPMAPPAGAPNYFLRHRDDEAHGPFPADPAQDFLEIFELSPDFAVPANSTFTGPTSIPIAEIDSELCGFFAFSCFPQPSGLSPLDPLREVVMWRAQYRNLGTHATLVGNLVTDVNGANQGGIRWFELQDSGAGWTLFQEGTFAPDSDNRFMGSAASDIAGNIALGYNVSSSTTFPSLRYTGRLAGDPLGVMTQGETVLAAGSGSNSSVRYGDYSSMNVDPDDDCTFWFTGEYNPASQWATQIGSFRFDACPASLCGNGVIDPGEECDGGNLGGASCQSEGFGGGNLSCSAGCTLDTSGCTDCVTDVIGGPTSCKPPQIWAGYAEDQCHAQGLFLNGLDLLTPCGGGNYRFAKFRCCATRPSCKKGSLGGPTSCKSPATWFGYAQDQCQASGLVLSSFNVSKSCGGGNYRFTDFTCCKP